MADSYPANIHVSSSRDVSLLPCKRKRKEKNSHFWLTVVCCVRNLKNTDDVGVLSLNASVRDKRAVFRLKFRTPDSEVEDDHCSTWFGIATETARPRTGLSVMEV